VNFDGKKVGQCEGGYCPFVECKRLESYSNESWHFTSDFRTWKNGKVGENVSYANFSTTQDHKI
jgi:hypothetical protein